MKKGREGEGERKRETQRGKRECITRSFRLIWTSLTGKKERIKKTGRK